MSKCGVLYRLGQIFFGLALLALVMEAQAAKFGRSKSFGFQKPIQYRALQAKPAGNAKPAGREAHARTERSAGQPASAPAGKQTATQQVARNQGRQGMMGGLLGGLLAGGLLAALFFGGAFDGLAPMDWLLILLVIGGLIFWLRRRAQARSALMADGSGAVVAEMPSASRTQPASETAGASLQVETPDITPPPFGGSGAAELPDPPVWFDEEQARRSAEKLFYRVQQAWDQGDAELLADICERSCFEAVKEQIQPGVHQTEVEFVNPEIIDWDYVKDQFVMSVRFNGFVRENGGESHGFTEVWHLARPVTGIGPWKILGVQQL